MASSSNTFDESSILLTGNGTHPETPETLDETPVQFASKWMPAADKTFEKLIAVKGAGLKCPREGSVCVVRMTPLDISILPSAAKDAQEAALVQFIDERSLYFRDARDFKSQEVVVGESDTEFDSMVDKILESMKPGECAQVKFRIHANEDLELNSGSNNSAASTAKPFVEVHLELYLLDCTLVEEVWQMKPDKLLVLAQHHKDRGVMWYKEENFIYALRRFTKAIRLLLVCKHLIESPIADGQADLPSNAAENGTGKIAWTDNESFDLRHVKQQVDKLCSAVYANIAAIQLLKMPNTAKNLAGVVSNCTKAINCDKSNLKALCRRGIAYKNLQEFDLAKRDFCQLLEQDPDNTEVQKELKKLEVVAKKETNMLSANLRKAFL